MNTKTTGTCRVAAIFLLAAGLWGCTGEPPQLTLDDLTPQERTFIERYVVIERARAVALADPPLGQALLDSLGAAWGDSANAETKRLLPGDPARLAAVNRLLSRVLASEEDSLVMAPRADRLAAPLTEPPKAPPPP